MDITVVKYWIVLFDSVYDSYEHPPSQVSVTLSGPLIKTAAEQQCSEVVKGKHNLTYIKT